MVKTFQRRHKQMAALAVVLIIGTWGTLHLWRIICGNYPIGVYGRIINERGVGIAGVNIAVQITYSPMPAIPVPMGRAERIQNFTVATDDNGYFHVTGNGYGVSLIGFEKPGKRLIDAKPPPYSPSTWVFDSTISRAQVPSNPMNPVVYVFKESELVTRGMH